MAVLNRNSKGGGVLCWVSDLIIAKRKLNYELPGLEALWLELSFCNNKLNLCTIYRPPSSDNTFWENLQNSINRAKNSSVTSMMIIGDLNADPHTYAGSKLNHFSYVNNLSKMVHSPT